MMFVTTVKDFINATAIGALRGPLAGGTVFTVVGDFGNLVAYRRRKKRSLAEGVTFVVIGNISTLISSRFASFCFTCDYFPVIITSRTSKIANTVYGAPEFIRQRT